MFRHAYPRPCAASSCLRRARPRPRPTRRSLRPTCAATSRCWPATTFRAAPRPPRARPGPINYIAEQFRARGLEPAGESGTWFQPVGAGRAHDRRSHDVAWTGQRPGARPSTRPGSPCQGREAEMRLANAPVIFAGHGARLPERGIDQLAGADVHGAVVDHPVRGARTCPAFPRFSQRVRGGHRGRRRRGDRDHRRRISSGASSPATISGRRPSSPAQAVAPIVGAMPQAAAAAAARRRRRRSRAGCSTTSPARPSAPSTLPIRATLQVTTDGPRLYEQQCHRPAARQRQQRREPAAFSPIGTISAPAARRARPTGSATARSTMPAASRC